MMRFWTSSWCYNGIRLLGTLRGHECILHVGRTGITGCQRVDCDMQPPVIPFSQNSYLCITLPYRDGLTDFASNEKDIAEGMLCLFWDIRGLWFPSWTFSHCLSWITHPGACQLPGLDGVPYGEAHVVRNKSLPIVMWIRLEEDLHTHTHTHTSSLQIKPQAKATTWLQPHEKPWAS